MTQLPLSTVLGSLAREAAHREQAAPPSLPVCEACGRPLPTLTPLDVPETRKARSHDPSSAREAARRSFPRQASQRHRILCAVARNPDGLTAEEAGEAAHVGYQSSSTRMTELFRGGWVRPADATRVTKSGARAMVWLLTDAARIKLASERHYGERAA